MSDSPAQFTASPYANNFFKVLLKGKSITWIHRGVVPDHVPSNKSTQDPAYSSATPTVDLQEIGYDTAHVIINFFYTKQYKYIKPSGIYGDTEKGYELKVSLQVIEAARKMKLPDLVDLAKKQCARVCHEMNLLNLISILGKMNIDYNNVPELTQHISLQLEKVLAFPHSPLASTMLSRATSNSITDILLRKLLMIARAEPTSEPKAKPTPGNEARGMPNFLSRQKQHTSWGFATREPEPAKLPFHLRTQQPQKFPENPQPDYKGKARDVSKPEEHASKASATSVFDNKSGGAKGQEEARSGPSKVRGWCCPFSPPCGGCADAEKASPAIPELGKSIRTMKSFIAPEKSSAADWEVPKSETEQSQKTETTSLVDSDDYGVLVDSETLPTVTPNPEDPRHAERMNLLYAYDSW
ncbi:uncharacterized protein FSUBG_1042 [Fusarium subglutinans]|uniref:BTB domain-containing protein n=1 Tax=Gibberella subglutinans TaxID=42677 RepID=A0A8H5QF18_GIBSU|nr:uncharacterized protein FSUBG_1042 [Fusarium subglutinans]KAF5613312.1 hypothetical protein FSUBG_1042 [Fusarium subglutinans]